MKHFEYLSYVLRHKWYVFVECWKSGIPLQGIVHDLSKFLPSEWFPYAEYFYGDWRKGNTDRQATAPEAIQLAFEVAWNYHQKRNKHHWQYWVRLGDDGTTLALEIPIKYSKEMVADWRGAGKAITGRDDTFDWYCKNQLKINMHWHTRYRVVSELQR